MRTRRIVLCFAIFTATCLLHGEVFAGESLQIDTSAVVNDNLSEPISSEIPAWDLLENQAVVGPQDGSQLPSEATNPEDSTMSLIPEPASIAMLLLGATSCGALAMRRRLG